MKLASSDLLILFLYLLAVTGVGLALRSRIRSAAEFFQAGRALPSWLGVLALLGASLGAPEVIGLGAAGARYGLGAAHFLILGAVPAMLFAGLFLMPVYYRSKARTAPEFLGLRFDLKTRLLSGFAYAATMVLSAGISLALMARIVQALHLFDGLFRAYGWEPEAVFGFTVVLASVVVLLYVVFGGLSSTAYNQALQFVVTTAALLPVALIGLRNVSGWSGLKQSLPPALTHVWTGGSGAQIALLAFVAGAAFWCADFRVLQIANAAKSAESARRTPVLAAVPRMLVALAIVVPGMIAIGLPTPQTHMIERVENGVIYHETTIVRPEVEAGQGLVPARIDAATGKPATNRAGQPLLNYEMAVPNALLHFIPAGMLGLGLAALLACLMGGVAASVTAFSTVATFDLYAPLSRQEMTDKRSLGGGRLAALGAMLLSVCTAFAVARTPDLLGALLAIFTVAMMPIFVVTLLGMFWKRTTGCGAFSGLIAGIVAAVTHYGMTLPRDAQRGLGGGWIAIAHHPPSAAAQTLGTAAMALMVSAIVAIAVSLFTAPRPEADVAGLLYAPARWARTEALAVAALLIAVVVSLMLVW